METRVINISAINGSVTVQVIRKNIKNVHLKVFRTFDVVLSVPLTVPDEWIDIFLSEHAEWINSQIYKYKKASGYNNLSSVKSGSSVQLLGKDMRVMIAASSDNGIGVDEKCIRIYLKDLSDNEQAQKMFDAWWRETAFQNYQKEMESIYQKVFVKHGIDKPVLLIRKMKTLWGSCTPQKNKITLNEYLLKADIRCIRYVILHELTHLIYPNHSKEFYDFLTIYMPDWKVCKQQLDTEVVQGL